MAILTSSPSCIPLPLLGALAAGGSGALATARFLLPVQGYSGAAAAAGSSMLVAVIEPPGGGWPAVLLSRRRCTTAGNLQPSECFEKFCEEIKQFRAHGTIALVDGAEMKLIGWISDTAKGSLLLLTGLMEANASLLPAQTLKEVTSIGKSFVEVEAQCNYGSVRFNNIVVAINGLMRMAEIFPGEGDPSKELLEKFMADGFVPDVFLGLYPLVKKKYPSIV